MSVKVLYFASLRETMGRREEIVSLDGEEAVTVAGIWARVDGREAALDRLLCAVNMEYASPDTPVHDGDEVAFFPPVTGG